MLDKLRRKFIFIIMALVTAALAIMAGVIVYLNYLSLSNDVMEAVQYATTEKAFDARMLDRNANPPDQGGQPSQAASSSGPAGEADAEATSPTGTESRASANSVSPSPEADARAGSYSGAESRANADNRKDGKRNNGLRRSQRAEGADMVATSVYILSQDGAVKFTLVDALEIDDESLQGLIDEVLAARASASGQDIYTSGHLAESGLYYGARETMGDLKVAFASDSYISNSIWNLAMVLLVVSACVWIAFLAISIALARWVVRPTERAWNQQQQFVADASHELKTPLAVMMANNSILLANPDQTVESQRRWVESNQTEARQMLELVNDMLFLARPENSERQQVRQTVDVSALVERNTLQFEAVCFERGMVLEEDIAPGATVQGDENRLQRLVSTLIDNACKYGDSRVSVKLSQTGSQIQLAVSNDGAIIPPEDIPHVFDRFYRVDKARVRSEGGVGLGLAIAQEVAREHGGSITVTSSEAAGTTFTATLPH